MARFDKELFAVPEGFDRMKEGVTYGKIAEYLMMSLLIITVCSVLFDISVHERDSRK